MSPPTASTPPASRHLTRQQYEERIEDLRFILDANSRPAWAKIMEVAGRLTLTGQNHHPPSGYLLRTLLTLHKLDAKGKDFHYRNRFNGDCQLLTTRAQLSDACQIVCHVSLTTRQISRALEVLEREGIIARDKLQVGPNKWIIILGVLTKNLTWLLKHPGDVGKSRESRESRESSKVNVNEKPIMKDGTIPAKLTKFGQHSFIRGMEVGSPGSAALNSSPTSIPLPPPSLRSKEVGGFATAPLPLAREFEPAVVKVIEMAETREIFCNEERARVARQLTQDEREALAGCVRTMGLTPAWLERYYGAINNHPEHYVIEQAEETWWLKVTPAFFVQRFWSIRRELERAQVAGALEMRALVDLPVTDTKGCLEYVNAQLNVAVDHCLELRGDPQGLAQFFADDTLNTVSATMRMMMIRTIPELETICPGLTAKVVTQWGARARQELMEDPRTLLVLAETFPVVEWLGLPSAAVSRAQEWVEKSIQLWNSEGAELQRRLNKCRG